ncbi:hypothetical protein AYI68_g930 [Smittium mucronatum]|uniref:Uncharacterized protein n=1 Tax=Smittium mucronatum TaxID=133383 RepID=A0A1R0H6Z9_9FUNG|nr:hypothetical protein AYI68_g930 [Smittium mucronatum]
METNKNSFKQPSDPSWANVAATSPNPQLGVSADRKKINKLVNNYSPVSILEMILGKKTKNKTIMCMTGYPIQTRT